MPAPPACGRMRHATGSPPSARALPSTSRGNARARWSWRSVGAGARSAWRSCEPAPSRGRAGCGAGRDAADARLPRAAGRGMDAAVLEHPAQPHHRPAAAAHVPPAAGWPRRPQDAATSAAWTGPTPARIRRAATTVARPTRTDRRGAVARCRAASARPSRCACWRDSTSPTPRAPWAAAKAR